MIMVMPDDEPLHQANDKLFKQGFSEPETAAGFLAAYLPGDIAAAVDWPRLQLRPGTFIDSRFRRHESDLLFSAPLAGREAMFYFLFEHQTEEDPAIALRLLRYMVRIWEECLQSRPKDPLPVILPVVLAQNSRAWKLQPAFSELLEVPAGLEQTLRPFIPDFLFRLVQLAQIPFEAIRGTPAGIMVLRVMKAERDGALLSQAVWDETMLRQLPAEIFEMLLRFIVNADIDTVAVERRVETLQEPELRNSAMSYAQKLRHEGRQEGRQEGRLTSLRENVVEALEVRFSGVPDGLRETIMAIADETRLRALLRAAIQCTSLEAFSEAL